MKILVLGSAAGGGFPQWNCNCRNCRGIRDGSIRALPRTQSSIAVSPDSNDWILINASPDILTQIKSLPRLSPKREPRDAQFRAVVLVDSQIDHTVGLLMLREGERLPIFCTANVHDDLATGNPILRVLESYCGTEWHRIPIEPDSGFTAPGVDDLRFSALAVAGKAPPYSPRREAPLPGDNIALTIEDRRSRKSLFYAPGLASVDEAVVERMKRADCILIDGTFWTSDEMIRQGVGRKYAGDMGHLAQSGTDGMLAHLERIDGPRKVLIHINNTNPILDEDSVERRELARAGVEVAYDGMEIDLP
ncbi:MAG TPA: pyrroloquinoline quinone biosynthesis protein PqqB [Candidatus Binataceae bacterium]|nr:pyrroloquinoline quinone biosynthesis protein PqqB [Candidatus Binataceae bacterium]